MTSTEIQRQKKTRIVCDIFDLLTAEGMSESDAASIFAAGFAACIKIMPPSSRIDAIDLLTSFVKQAQ